MDNGSNDNSKKIFNDLKERDHKIKILEIEKNISYGYGIKKGLLESKSDYILINHSDGQFDTFSYFMTHLYEIKNMIIADSIFSFRINRPFKQKLITYILRLFLSFLNFKKIKEFNGQPKLVKNIFDLHECSKLPNDFSLDYAIYNRIKPKIFFPVIQKSRKEGESSWAGSALRSIKVLKMYIKQSLGNESLHNQLSYREHEILNEFQVNTYLDLRIGNQTVKEIFEFSLKGLKFKIVKEIKEIEIFLERLLLFHLNS